MRSGLSLVVPLFVFLTSVDANLNLSSHRARRIGHTSPLALPRTLHADRFARHINGRGDGDDGGILGGLGGGLGSVLGGAGKGVGSAAGGLGNGVGSIAGGAGDTLGGLGGSNSPPPQDDDPNQDGSSSGSLSSTPSASNPTSSSTATASDDDGHDHGAPTPSISNDVPVTPSPTPTPTSSSGGLLGGIGSGLSQIAGGAGTGISQIGGGAGTGISQIGGGVVGSPTPTPSPPPSSDPSSGDSSSAASSSGGGGILPPLSIPPILAPPPSSSNSDSSTAVIIPDPTQSSTPSDPSPAPSSSNGGGILPTIVTSLLPPVASITSALPPILSPPATSSPTLTIIPGPSSGSGTDSPTSSDSGIITLPTILPPISIPGGSNDSTVDSGTSTITDVPPSTTTDVPANVTTTNGSNGTAISGNSSTVLSIPTTSLFPTTTTDLPESLSTVTPTSTDAVDSQFSFVTASSLVIATMTSIPASVTQTDPDAVISSTIVSTPVAASQGAAPAVPSLPPNLPQRIFSPNSVNPLTDKDELADKTLVSLLFQAELNWYFMNRSDQTVGQVFAYMPKVITTALDISDSDVKTYALQVEIPEGWQGDLDKLGTMYLCYIPNDQVNTLSVLIKAQNSKFYNQGSVQGQLAGYVVPTFSVLSVSSGSVGGNDAASGTGNGSPNKSNKTRTDAIIGVCAAIGGVAALVAVWWSVRYVQRKRAAKHRRLSNLSDPNASNGVYGTQHDDRRTSFFYAEDELRGGYRPQDATGYTHPAQPQPAEESVMQQRRPAMPHAPISAPVLHENSLNW